MNLFVGLFAFYIASFSFAGTAYECIGGAKLKSNLETNTKVKLTIEKIFCPKAKNDKLFAIASEAPLKDSDYKVSLNALPNSKLKKNDSVYFRVSWSCDKICREKTWAEIPETEFIKSSAE